MATYVSKTLIPWKTPIGSATGGGYLYEEDSKATTAPKFPTSIYTPPTLLPTTKTPLGFNIMPSVNKEVAKKQNAPVKDTLWLAKKIKEGDERVKQLREHFDYLKNNNELFLNDKQTDYIKRFKEKYPDYSNAPDAILYWKILLADPKVQEKYGNIGEKTFLQNALELPYKIGKAGEEAINRWADLYQQGINSVQWEATTFDKIMASIPAVLRWVWEGSMNIAWEILTTADEARQMLPWYAWKDYSPNTTRYSEDIGNVAWQIIQWWINIGDKITQPVAKFIQDFIPEEYQQDLRDANARNPNVILQLQYMLESGVEIANILPFLKIKWPSPAWIDELASKKWAWEDVIQFVKEKAKQGGTATKEFFAKKPPVAPWEFNAVTPTGESIFIEETPWVLMNTRDKIFNSKPDEELAFRAVSPRQNKATTPKQITEIGQKNLDAMQQLYADARTGRITSDITTMWGGAEAIDKGLTYWGKKIGDLTEGDSVVQVNDIATILKNSLDDPKTKLNKNLRGLAETVVEVLWDDRYVNGISIKELQSVISDIKGQIFADKNNIMALTRETAWKSLSKFLDEIGTRFDDAIENTTWDLVGLKEAKKAYSKYKSVQKDFLNSYLVQERSIKGWLSNLAGTTIGIVELLKNPTPMGIAKSVALKTLLKEIGISKSRGGAYEALIRSFDRQALTRKPLPNANNLLNNSDLSDSQMGQRPLPVDVATPKSVTPVVSWPGQSLAVSVDNWTIDVKKALEQFDKLTQEEKTKALNWSDKLRELVKVTTEIKDIQEFKGDFGYMPPEIVKSLGDNYLNYSPEAKEIIRKWLDKLDKEDLAILQKMNREKVGLPEPVVEEKKIDSKKPTKPALTKPKTSKVPEKNVFREQFGEGWDFYSENSNPDQLYAIAKRISEDEAGSLDDIQPRAKKNKADLKREVETVAKMKTAVEDYANDRGISNDEAFNEIKDFYEHAQENPRTIEDQVSKIENDMEQMRADYERDMKSQDESLATMEEPTTTETIEEVVTPVKDTPEFVETPMQEFEREVKELFDDVRKQDELDALKKEFDDLASIWEKERKKYAGKWISGQYDASGADFMTADQISRMTKLGGDIRRLEDELRGINSKSDLKKLLALKKELRKKWIEFKNDESLKSLQEKLDTELPKTPQILSKEHSKVILEQPKVEENIVKNWNKMSEAEQTTETMKYAGDFGYLLLTPREFAKISEYHLQNPNIPVKDLIDAYKWHELNKFLKKWETPQEGKTQNFTQFAKEKWLASDYDITDHSALSPSWHVSKTTKTRSEERTLARIKENEQAHKLYEDEIKKWNIVDPSNNVTKERLLSAETKKIVDDLEKQINAINSNIKFVESLWRKPNWDLKIGIKRTRDDYLARRKVLQDKLDEVKPKSSLPLSQKSEVKYSEPDLASEAKKYKSADDFIKAQEWSMYFHWTNVDFKKPDVSKVGTGEWSIMAGKWFNLTSLSSDAKNYAYQVSQKKWGKEVILWTKIDKNKMNLFDADKMDKDVKMQSEIIDFILKKQNEFKWLTKDKIIGKLDDKWTWDFMWLIEEEYWFAKYVDDFIKSKWFDWVITKERTSQKWGKIRPENITIFNPKDIEMVNLIDIYNKANKK